MPEWYYVSGNAFSLYQEDWIAPYQNRMISKEHNLFEQEKQILEIYQTQRVAMWQDFFDQQITPILVTLQNLLTKKKQCCTTSPTLTIMEQHHYLLMQYIKEQKENIDLLSSLINQNKMLIPNTSIRDTFTRQHKRYYELLQEQMKLM